MQIMNSECFPDVDSNAPIAVSVQRNSKIYQDQCTWEMYQSSVPGEPAYNSWQAVVMRVWYASLLTLILYNLGYGWIVYKRYRRKQVMLNLQIEASCEKVAYCPAPIS